MTQLCSGIAVMALVLLAVQQVVAAGMHYARLVQPTSSVTYHHLKWITNQTQFPLELSVPIPAEQQQSAASTGSSWDWLRLNDDKFVSKMDELMKSYLTSETKEKASLVLLKYDNRSHEMLGSYEPVMTRTSSGGGERVVELGNGAASNKRDVFTLAYLKDHYIKSEKFPDRIKVTCFADFLIANTTMVDTIMSLMERYASFKMAVKSEQARYAGPPPGPRVSSHTQYHLRPNDVRRPPSQQQQQYQQKSQYEQQLSQQLQQIQLQLQQQMLQQQQMQQKLHQPANELKQLVEKLVHYQPPPPQLLQREKQQQQQQVQQIQQQIQAQALQQAQQQQQQALENQSQVVKEQIKQQDEQAPKAEQKEVVAAAAQQEQQQIPVAQYQQLYHPIHQIPVANYPMAAATHLQPAAYQNDLLNFYASLFYPSSSSSAAASRNLYSSQSSAAAQVATILPLSQQQYYGPSIYGSYVLPAQLPYDYFSPRLGKREIHSSVVETAARENGKFDYEHDHDESKFYKIRLSLGPISIYRPFEKEEVISCSLNLANIDTLLTEYENKIFETISTQEYQDNDNDEFPWLMGDQKPMSSQEKNDLMFLIDKKNEDPAVEVKKAFANKPPQVQEEMMSRMRDMPISQLIEMERQLNALSSAAAPTHRVSLLFTFISALLCLFMLELF